MNTVIIVTMLKHFIEQRKFYKPTATEKAYAQELLKAAKIGKLSEDMDVGEDMAQAYSFEGMTLEEFDKYVVNWMKSM